MPPNRPWTTAAKRGISHTSFSRSHTACDLAIGREPTTSRIWNRAGSRFDDVPYRSCWSRSQPRSSSTTAVISASHLARESRGASEIRARSSEPNGMGGRPVASKRYLHHGMPAWCAVLGVLANLVSCTQLQGVDNGRSRRHRSGAIPCGVHEAGHGASTPRRLPGLERRDTILTGHPGELRSSIHLLIRRAPGAHGHDHGKSRREEAPLRAEGWWAASPRAAGGRPGGAGERAA